MRLRPEQLAARLHRYGTAPVYLLHGEEPLQLIECADLVRARARTEGYSERRVLGPDGLDWNGLRAELESSSLFASRRLVELRMEERKPGTAGAKALTALAARPPADVLLLISFAALPAATRRSAWFTALEKAGVELHARPVGARAFPKWLAARAEALGLHLDHDALQLLGERTEGNLLAARQELQLLSLFARDGEQLGAEQLAAMVGDSGRYKVFDLMEQACRGEAAQALRMLEGLRAEGTEAVALFGALAWDLRRVCTLVAEHEQGGSLPALCRKHRIWGSRVEAVQCLLKRTTARGMEVLLGEAIQVEKTIKGGIRDDPWRALGWFIMHLAGAARAYPVSVRQLRPAFP